MAVLTYNSVQLPLPITTRFSQEAVYDDEGQTDWCLTRFVIGVQCVLNTAYLQVKVGDGKPLDAPGIMNALRTFLLKPRKQLSFKVNGVEMIPAAQTGVSGTVDARNGPTPVVCALTQLTDVSFFLNYEIVAHYWVKPTLPGTELNGRGGNVLYNRWRESVELDQYMMSTRTRTGSFRIRSDNADGVTADELRSQLAVLSIPFNFLRVKQKYEVSPDGLQLNYAIVDHEVYKMPPRPAFRAEGEYTDENDGAMANHRLIQTRVKLYGSPETPQLQLIDAAITIAATKVQTNRGQPVKGTANIGPIPLPVKFALKVWMYDNIVEVFYVAKANLTTASSYKTAVWEGQPLTYTPLTDDQNQVLLNQNPPYKDRGTAALLLEAAAYYDPSVVGEVLGTSVITTADNPTTTRGGSFGTQPKYQMNAAKSSGTKTVVPGQGGKTSET